MNKTLLLAGVAACLFAANANAVELKQYPFQAGRTVFAERRLVACRLSLSLGVSE